MEQAINVLMVEDSEEDALLVIRQLTHAGLAPKYERVETSEDFLKTLKSTSWDIVLSDYTMPSFNGIEALELLHKFNPDIPFIFVSGTINEDLAVTAMKHGASDYVLKGNLKRLAPAVERSINDAKIKKERKLYENQFLQAQKMESLGQLTSGMAHDFNNLLMVIQGSLYLLRMDLSGNEEYTKLIDQALEASGTGADLIKRLMSFSRQQQLKPDVINLKELLPSTSKLLQPLLGATIKINVSIANDTWTTVLDEVQLESAIVNMAINARDAMQGNGALTIEAKNVTVRNPVVAHTSYIQPGDYVRISVKDCGCGISPENLEHVFDPFFTTKEEGKGTGLGLSMVYGFVKQSRGYITINSIEGQGTTIYLYFPKNKTENVAESKTHSEKVSNLKGSECILLCEDDETLRKLTTQYLESLGYPVIPAKDGIYALECLKQNTNVQLLISDVIMSGGLTGPELADIATQKYPNLKVIFVSGYPRKDLFERHIKNRNIPILTKPFSRTELAILLRKMLDTSH